MSVIEEKYFESFPRRDSINRWNWYGNCFVIKSVRGSSSSCAGGLICTVLGLRSLEILNAISERMSIEEEIQGFCGLCVNLGWFGSA